MTYDNNFFNIKKGAKGVGFMVMGYDCNIHGAREYY
jgi:hypothetical protein